MRVKVSRSRARTKSSTLSPATVLIATVLCGAMFLAGKSRATLPPEQLAKDEPGKELMLPVPVQAVAQGESLENVEFVYVKWSAGEQTAGFVNDIAPYRKFVATKRLGPYMPIASSSIKSESLESNEVVERIPEGMRAITVKVDAESAVEGWAQSGSFVDVMVMRRLSNDDNSIETKVIAENVKILSAGRSTKTTSADMPRPPATVTLLVDQSDALRIKTATHLGKITFSLRGLGDETPTLLTQMNQRALLGSSKVVLPTAKPFRGTATGPDGGEWVLTESNHWHKKEVEINN